MVRSIRVFGAVCLAVASAGAQQVSILGCVRDTVGSPLGGVAISLVAKSTIVAVTGSDGTFRLTDLGSAVTHRPGLVRSASSARLINSTVCLSLDKSTPVSIEVYNSLGRLLARPLSRTLPAGAFRIPLRSQPGHQFLYVRAVIGRDVQVFQVQFSGAGVVGAGVGQHGLQYGGTESSQLAKIAATADTLVAVRGGLLTLRLPVSSYNPTDSLLITMRSSSGSFADGDPQGLLWSNSGWKGVTAVDLVRDTVFEVVSGFGPAPSGIAVGKGTAFACFSGATVKKISTTSLLVTDSNMVSGDTGNITFPVADAANLWVADAKAGRPTRVLKISAANLQVLAANPVQSDSCTVTGMAMAGSELWLCHTNPPTLSRVNTATGAVDANISLASQFTGAGQFCVTGRTGLVLSDSAKLVKVNLDTRTVAATYDLSTSIGPRLTIAASSAGIFVGRTGTTPVVVHKLAADYTTAAATFQASDTSLDQATLSFLRARGSRLVAVVARGWYNQYAEIDVPTMTLKRGIGETYCYGMEIGE